MDVFNVGKLVSFDWELGVATQSAKCDAINAPFVRVHLKVEDSDGRPVSRSFELTLLEFKVCFSSPPSTSRSEQPRLTRRTPQKFAKSLRDISNVMETL